MYARTIDDVDIKGLMVSIYDYRKQTPERLKKCKNACKRLKKRKLVAPEWIELFFRVQNPTPAGTSERESGTRPHSYAVGETNLWNALSSSDKDFFSYVVHNFLKGDPEFQKKIQPSSGSNIIYIIANSYKDVYTRMRLLEDSVKAGINNEQVWDEYKALINRLVDSGQIEKHKAVMILRQHGL